MFVKFHVLTYFLLICFSTTYSTHTPCPSIHWISDGGSRCYLLVNGTTGNSWQEGRDKCRASHPLSDTLWLDSKQEKEWFFQRDWSLDKVRGNCLKCALDSAWVGLHRDSNYPYDFLWAHDSSKSDNVIESNDWYRLLGHPRPPVEGKRFVNLVYVKRDATGVTQLLRTHNGTEKMWHFCKIDFVQTTTTIPDTYETSLYSMSTPEALTAETLTDNQTSTSESATHNMQTTTVAETELTSTTILDVTEEPTTAEIRTKLETSIPEKSSAVTEELTTTEMGKTRSETAIPDMSSAVPDSSSTNLDNTHETTTYEKISITEIVTTASTESTDTATTESTTQTAQFTTDRKTSTTMLSTTDYQQSSEYTTSTEFSPSDEYIHSSTTSPLSTSHNNYVTTDTSQTEIYSSGTFPRNGTTEIEATSTMEPHKNETDYSTESRPEKTTSRLIFPEDHAYGIMWFVLLLQFWLLPAAIIIVIIFTIGLILRIQIKNQVRPNQSLFVVRDKNWKNLNMNKIHPV